MKWNIFILSLCPWCKVQIPVDVLPEEYNFYVYNSGAISNKGVCDGFEINKRLKADLSDWSYDVNTYAPSLKLVSDNISIICVKNNKIIINYMTSDKKFVQVSKLSPPLCDSLFVLLENYKKK
ncbi:TPA: hypothetical protein I8235_000760 [Kluyvera intermedia]|nr:hypothetical protein [Kluyvera intermedia]